MKYQALTKEQVRKVIRGQGAADRIPVLLHLWVHQERFGDRQQAVEDVLDKYPADILQMKLNTPQVFDAPADDASYRWANFDDPYKDTSVGIDEKIAMQTWDNLDEILADFPDPNYVGLIPEKPADDGRYRLANWWFCFFERLWSLRGMTNGLMDFYTDGEKVHKLFRKLTDFYKVMLERCKNELGADGVLTSDDIGTQDGPFFSPDVFNDFFKPYYTELFEKAHSLDMEFWLHTCGCIEPFLPGFIEAGLDVIHPIQRHTMNFEQIAEKYGKDICIWAGIEVQQVIPWGTADEVRQEVRYIFDTFRRPEGRLMFTAGNGINEDCRIDALEALFDEAYSYGSS